MTQTSMTRPLTVIAADIAAGDDVDGFELPDLDAELLRVVIPHHATARTTHLVPSNSGGLQCDTCGGTFGVTLWTCAACQALRLATRGAGAAVTRTQRMPNDACPLCGWWSCNGNCPKAAARPSWELR